MPPPTAKRIPFEVTFGQVDGEDRGSNPMDPPRHHVDDLFWLRDDDRKNEDVLAHLRAENAHTESVMAGARTKQLYKELRSHLKEDDTSAAYPDGGYRYYTRTEEGKSYKIHCRTRAFSTADVDGPEQVVLDENEVAAPHKFCSTGAVEVSPSHGLLAYATDTSGYETYIQRESNPR